MADSFYESQRLLQKLEKNIEKEKQLFHQQMTQLKQNLDIYEKLFTQGIKQKNKKFQSYEV